MKRSLISAAAAAVLVLLAAAVPLAHAAGSVDASLTVSATLTSKCQVASGDAGTLSFTYTAFGAETAQTGPGLTVTFECTRGLAAPTVVFDSDGGTTTSSGTAAAASVVGNGIVAGLRYEVTATRQTTGAGTAADPSSIGTAATVPYLITGRIFGNQAGDATATATQGRTLTLAY